MFCCLSSSPGVAIAVLERVARTCSPRIARHGASVVFDVSGSTRTIGPPAVIVREVTHLARAQGITPRVAIGPTTTAAWMLAEADPDRAVTTPDAARVALARVPIRWLEATGDLDNTEDLRPIYLERVATFRRWGLATFGDVAALSRSDVHARMGNAGVRLHQVAQGEDARPMVLENEARRFVERMELEWPIEDLEPLSFVLARLCERLSARLMRADRGAVTLHTRLQLVTRDVHVRVLQIPSPMHDPRVLRTLVLLDLETHPPAAAVDVVELEVEVAPGRIVQGTLLSTPLPTAEDLATLLARLGALMGDTRVGVPVLLDTFDARRIEMASFRLPKAVASLRPVASARTTPALYPAPCLRRFRLPIAARVIVERGAPVRVMPAARALAGGRVVDAAGPWRSSGGWWTFDRAVWDRDEWDLELADGGVYRVTKDRQRGVWEIEGVLD